MAIAIPRSRRLDRADGRSVSFEDVYRLHADAVYRYCLGQLGDRAAAEDVAAEAFAAAFEAWRRGRAPSDAGGMRPWVFRIARNAAVDHQRRGLRRGRLLRLLGQPRHEATVEAAAEQRSELRAVLAVLDALRPRDRSLVALRVAGGLSFSDIGAALGLSEQAAKVATHRALERVRAHLHPGDPAPGHRGSPGAPDKEHHT